MRKVIQRSYQTGGITEVATEVRKAKAAGEKRRHYRHAVFARGGLPCRRCGTKIQRSMVASRQFYLCPRCQPA